MRILLPLWQEGLIIGAYMTIQEYTYKMDRLKWTIESKKERIRVLEDIAMSTTSSICGMPHAPSPSLSRMADAIDCKIDVESSIKEDEAAIRRLKETMALAIDRIDSPKHRTVLYKKYIRNLTVGSIAQDIRYSERSTKRLISEGNHLLEEVLSSA